MYRLKILMIMLLALFLVGCDKPADTGDTIPANIFQGYYDSYEKLETAFTSVDGDAVIAAENVELYGEEFKQFVDAIAQEDMQFRRPYLGKELISLEDKRGISLYSYGSGKPEIWYHLMIEDQGCIMTIEYLSEDEQEYAKTHTLLETITYIYPEYGKSLKNWWWDFSVKKQSTESWQLLDRQVETISSEYRGDDTRIYKRFIYDNMYVTLRAEPEVFEDAIWSQFHLK